MWFVSLFMFIDFDSKFKQCSQLCNINQHHPAHSRNTHDRGFVFLFEEIRHLILLLSSFSSQGIIWSFPLKQLSSRPSVADNLSHYHPPPPPPPHSPQLPVHRVMQANSNSKDAVVERNCKPYLLATNRRMLIDWHNVTPSTSRIGNWPNGHFPPEREIRGCDGWGSLIADNRLKF